MRRELLLKPRQLASAVGVLVLILGGAYFILPLIEARKVVHVQVQQIETLTEKISLAQNVISSSKAEYAAPQELGPARRSAKEASSYSETFSSIKYIDLPQKIDAFYKWSLIKKVNSLAENQVELINAYRKSTDTLDQVDKLLAYRSQSLKALVNILEYNPRDDFQNFALGSQQTSFSLKAAKIGLAKAADNLKQVEALYADPGLKELQEISARLQKERELLEKEGDLPRWINEIESAQKQALANREKFWLRESAEALENLAEAKKLLQKNTTEWLSLKNSFF